MSRALNTTQPRRSGRLSLFWRIIVGLTALTAVTSAARIKEATEENTPRIRFDIDDGPHTAEQDSFLTIFRHLETQGIAKLQSEVDNALAGCDEASDCKPKTVTYLQDHLYVSRSLIDDKGLPLAKIATLPISTVKALQSPIAENGWRRLGKLVDEDTLLAIAKLPIDKLGIVCQYPQATKQLLNHPKITLDDLATPPPWELRTVLKLPNDVIFLVDHMEDRVPKEAFFSELFNGKRECFLQNIFLIDEMLRREQPQWSLTTFANMDPDEFFIFMSDAGPKLADHDFHEQKWQAINDKPLRDAGMFVKPAVPAEDQEDNPQDKHSVKPSPG